MKKNEAGNGTGNIMELLALVANGKLNILPPPERKKQKGDVVRHVILSPIVPRLWSASVLVAKEQGRITMEHDQAHDCHTVKVERHDCEAYAEADAALEKRYVILRKILNQAVYEEFPPAASNDFEIAGKWEMFSMNGSEWNDTVLFPDKNDFFNTFTSRVMAIIQGEIPDGKAYATDSKVRDGEKVVGEVSDLRLRAFMSLLEQARQEVKKLFPANTPLSGEGNLSFEKFKSWAGDRKVSELQRLSEAGTRLKELEVLSNDLFWRGVRDTIPGADKPTKIGLREGWKIVEVETNLDALADMPLPVKLALLEALLGFDGSVRC